MKGVLLSGVAAVLLLGGGVASAADLYRAPVGPVPVVPYVLAFSWTGFYLGGNVGYGCCGDDRVDILLDDTRRRNRTFLGNTGDAEPEGVFGGLQLGYNWQWGGLVVGVEADWQWSGLDNSAGGTLSSRLLDDQGGKRNIALKTTSEINWFGTVRPRIGFAWDRVLVYGTGGFAWGDVDYNVHGTTNHTPGHRARGNKNDIHTGFAAGGGAEVAWAPNWTTKLEYQYVDLGSEGVFGVLRDGKTDTGRRISTEATPDFHSVRLGINYKFGYEPAPPPPAAVIRY